MPDPNDILTGLKNISDWVDHWVGPLAAIGAMSMALIQLAKNTSPWRSGFQRDKLREWLGMRNKDQAGEAERDLIRITTSGDAGAFYHSDVEDVCNRIKSAVSVILDYPEHHQALLQCLASPDSAKDLDQILHPPPVEMFAIPVDQAGEKEKERIRVYASAKTRLGLEIRSGIDALNVHISFRWKCRLQWVSIALSAALGMACLLFAQPSWYSLPAMLAVGLLAGFIAPFARDLMAAVEKWRT